VSTGRDREASPLAPGRARGAGGVALGSAWPWRIVVIALVGLLVAVVAACLVALTLTRSVTEVAERTLLEDVEFEDEAEDVLVAILALKSEHRSLSVAGPTRLGIEEHDTAVTTLTGELTELDAVAVDAPGAPTAAELRSLLDDYERSISPILHAPPEDRASFDEAMDAGLAQLATLERSATSLDAIASARAASGLQRLGDQTALASTILVGVLVAALAAGVALTVLAVRVLAELRRLAAAERRAASEVGELLDARTTFIAEASHELRTPLTVLRGNAELGTRLAPADDPHVPILRDIAAEASRMSRLVEEMLFLARHDAGASPIEPETVELEVLGAEIAARGEALARERGAPLEVELAATGSARLDADRIGQAVLVLVDNAASYGPPGEPIALRWTLADERLLVDVDDRGPGIPPEVLPQVFQRFRRADPSGRRRGGAGLGLAIALAIAEEHGGTITPGARPGGGTRMRLSIPLDRGGR
jgi:signal transduction histidine kinase